MNARVDLNDVTNPSMKRLILFLILGLFSQAFSRSAEPIPKPLKELHLDLTTLEFKSTHKYKWSNRMRGGKKTETIEITVS